MDARIVAGLVIWLTLLFTVRTIVIWRTQRVHPGYGRWAIASLLVLLALLLFSLRSITPGWINAVTVDAFLAAAATLYLEGARESQGLAPRTWVPYAGGAAVLGAAAFFSYVVPNLNARAGMLSGFMGVFFLLVSIRLFHWTPPARNFGVRVLGAMFGLCGATLLTRALYCYFGPPISDPLALSGIDGALVLGICAQMAAFSVGFVLPADERPAMDSDAVEKRASRAGPEVAEHIKTGVVLRESEVRFRELADVAPVMIWASGKDRLCTFFNKPWLDFKGRSIEQELGDGWAEGVHPDDLDRCLAMYNSSFEARRSFQMEYRLRRADGEYRWILHRGTPLYREGEFAGLIGSAVDVTQQRLLAERLRSQQIQLLDAQRLAKLGSWERHVETDSITWSDETLRIFGRPELPSALPDFLILVHPKDRDKVLKAAEEVDSNLFPVELSYRIVRPDGEVRFVRTIVEAIRDDRGATIRTVGSIQDITDQVRASELLRKSEELLKNAERLAHLGHWQWDIRVNHISWSEEMFRIFGQPQSYIATYEKFLQSLVPWDKERVDQAVRNSLASKTGHSMDYQITHPGGDWRTISCTWEVVQDEEGSADRMFGTCQDVTDLRRSQKEDFARQKLESVGTLASGIAHDFNNLLGGVLAQAELAMGELAAGSRPEEQLKGIRNVALRGSEIVRQLMIYAGKENPAVELVDLSRIVKEMLELLGVSVSKHAVLETEMDPNLPAVRANAAQLRQIVMNLVTNASDAIGDRDGAIRVATKRVKLSDGSVDCDCVQLEVSDTGRGIPPEVQVKVFDPFFTTKSAGHGLGLSVVQGIVRGLGGSMRLFSEPGQGTTFQILLPCAETAAEEIRSQKPDTDLAVPFQGSTALIVEDENSLRQAVAKMLRKTGLEVLEAADGLSAIDLLRARGSKIDLILLDMTIPGPSSRVVATEAARVRPDAKVVLTSAYSQEMIADAMDLPQIRSFIRKPFQFAELVQTIRNALSS
jgi:two-component system, cell cycle sensor histidine kinase and response regulator CckA